MREEPDRPKLQLHHGTVEIERKFLVASDEWRAVNARQTRTSVLGCGDQAVAELRALVVPIIHIIGASCYEIKEAQDESAIKNSLDVSGHFREASERVLRVVIQATNFTAVISLFIYFQIGSKQNFGRKFLDSETNRICRVVKTHIFKNT
jgi:hypothetical protein